MAIRRRITVNKKVVAKYFKTQVEGDEWVASMREKLNDKELEGEEWRDIPNFSRYQASSFGRLRSLDYKNSGCVKVITPAKCKDGYMQTMLQNDLGEYKSWKAHKFVAMAFYGHQPTHEVNHIDGVKTNNRPENLEYCTRSENVTHAFRTGLATPRRGEEVNTAKLTTEQVREIRHAKETRGRFWGRNAMAEKFGVTAKHLQKIANGDDLWKSA